MANKVVVFRDIELEDPEGEDPRGVFTAYSEDSYRSKDFEEYEVAVLKIMGSLGFTDTMAFNYENFAKTLEENIETLKNDSRIIYMGVLEYYQELPELPADS